jgi:hypothetical protein
MKKFAAGRGHVFYGTANSATIKVSGYDRIGEQR